MISIANNPLTPQIEVTHNTFHYQKFHTISIANHPLTPQIEVTRNIFIIRTFS